MKIWKNDLLRLHLAMQADWAINKWQKWIQIDGSNEILGMEPKKNKIFAH